MIIRPARDLPVIWLVEWLNGCDAGRTVLQGFAEQCGSREELIHYLQKTSVTLPETRLNRIREAVEVRSAALEYKYRMEQISSGAAGLEGVRSFWQKTLQGLDKQL